MYKIPAIKKFLKAVPCPIAQMYNENMETQVMVAQDNGKAYAKTHAFGTSRGWTDGKEQWKNFRIPFKADTNPEYRDTEVGFNFNEHVDAIGMTGWDWKNRRSLWFAYDFDSIVNHDAGISIQEMEDIQNACLAIPYLGVLKSTSGKGLHIYVFIEGGFPTANHNEHAALARSFLGVLSAKLGMPLESSVDCVGSVLWVWARRSEGTRGLTWVKENTEKFPADKMPKNWTEHLSVIQRKRTRIKSTEKGVGDVASAISGVELESDHKSILGWFTQSATRVWWWDQDNQMLVGHTKDFEDCHKELELRGLFTTTSSETSPYNCFAFPVEGGRFVIRRFGQGCNEHNSWQPDTKGWTKVLFNENPTFLKTMLYHEGLMNKKQEVVFSSLTQANLALSFLGIKVVNSPALEHRQAKVRFLKKDSLISIDVTREKNDTKELGWIQSGATWEKTVQYNEEELTEGMDINLDHKIRHTIMGDTDSGWFLEVEKNWVSHNITTIGLAVLALRDDLKADSVKRVMGKQVLNPWRRVSHPFEDEYPGKRVWNKGAPQFSVTPARGNHPTWDGILEHCGADLDTGVNQNEWCKLNGINSGAEYLFYWAAFMFQKPNQRNPYLFFYGSQDTGKSSFHEALGLLFDKKVGYMNVKNSFKNKGDFNGEMAGCVLGYMDEINLADSKTAYTRLKDWTTALDLLIQVKGQTPYLAQNNIHLIHTANYSRFCPVEQGDTRITVSNVPTLKRKVPKDVLLKLLIDEAPAMLKSFLEATLPNCHGRLGLPALESETKNALMDTNATALERYILEECSVKEGAVIEFSEFKNCYKGWLLTKYTSTEVSKWSDARISQEFPLNSPLVKGSSTRHNNKVCIGNLQFKDDTAEFDTYIKDDGLWKQNGKKLRYLTNEEKENEF